MHLRRGWAHSENDNSLDAAIADYNQAIELDDENVRAYRSKGYAYYKQGKHDEAIENYTKAINLDSKHILTYVRRCLAVFESDHPSKAKQDFEAALKLAEDAENSDLKTQIEQIWGEISSSGVKPNE